MNETKQMDLLTVGDWREWTRLNDFLQLSRQDFLVLTVLIYTFIPLFLFCFIDFFR